MKNFLSFQRKLALFALCALSLCLLTTCVKEIALGSVQGIVTDATTNEPIQGVNISLSPTGLSSVTGSDGRYEFKNLEAGQYTVQATANGYESNTKSITIVQGNMSQGDMTLKPEKVEFKLNVDYLDFSTHFSQLSFKIINTGSLPFSWNITESLEWLTVTPSSGSLDGGHEVAVLVEIDRDLIEQSVSSSITIAGDDKNVVLPINVSVAGSQGPQLQLSETTLDFGTSTSSLVFYVLNTGPAGTSLNWTCSNINVDWLTIMPTTGNTDGGSSSAVMATIDRTKINGEVSTSVTVSGAGGSSTITIKASSEGAGVAILQLSEGSLDFGEEEVTKTFLVKNVGSTGTVLDWSITKPNDADWLTLTPKTGSTNANSSTIVTAVVDRSKIHGTVTATVAVNGSNNSANISVTAANYTPNLEVPVTSVDFGKLSTEQTIEIKNTGDEGSVLSWNITVPSSIEWLTVSPATGSINANQSNTVTLTIDRTKFTGDVSVTIQVTAGDQSTPVSVSASTPVASMNIPVTTVDFGKTSAQEVIEIRNTGETGSYLNWSIATPSVSWLTVSPMTGSATPTSMSLVTLNVDRSAFVGEETTSISITGAGTTTTIAITVDNRVVVTDGLYSYFTFDSDEIVDWTGNFSGLNYGVLFTDDAPGGTGKSAQFDGETSYIYIPDNVIPGGVPYSFNIWFKTGRNDQVLFGTKGGGSNYTHYFFSITGNACAYIQLGYGCYWTSTNPITAYVNNQWHMLTFTYNGTTANYYIDGVLLETTSSDRLLWANGLDAFYFGKHIKTSVYYGKLDNFRSYNRALTQNEVRAIYNAKQ